MITIAYVVHGHLNGGGTDRILASKANYLSRNGYKVHIITGDSIEEKPFFDFDEKIIFHHIAKCKRSTYINKVENLLNQIYPSITLSLGIGDAKYISRSKDQSIKVLEWHYAKYKKRYWLADIDSTFWGRFIADCYTLKRSRLAKSYQKLIILTEEDKKSWYGLNNINVIPNFIPTLPENKSDCSKKRVIAVGKYVPQKGFDILIDIWAKVSPQYPEWELVIFGKGKDKIKLEKQIKALNITTIKLNPPTKNINEEFRNSSIFAMSSRFEGLPMVLLEAMSVGLPVVSFACKCGPRDIITEGESGFLIPQSNFDLFAKRLMELMDNENLRQQMGAAARLRAEDFTEEKIMPKWVTLFDELLSNKKT